METFGLIHSPLVGPSTWSWVATELRHRGVSAIVPDLRPAAQADGTPEAVVELAARELAAAADIVLVGHSGAGLLLPAIAARVPGRVVGLCFVDAHLPALDGGAPPAEDDFVQFLEGLAVEGRLPQWSTWWSPERFAEMVTDPHRRRSVEADMPEVPLSYFSHQLAAEPGWTERACAYVRLSELYEPSASRAESYGWTVERFAERHLHAVEDPAAVTAAIVRVVAEATSG